MTDDDGENERPSDLGEDRDLVEQLTLLGRALGNPVRVRIAAALLGLDEAGPKDLAAIVDDSLGNVSYHVRYLNDLGFLRLERMIPRRGAIAHKYSIVESLRRALPAAAHALGGDARQPGSPSDDELVSLSYFLIRSRTREVVAAHSDALTRVGRALSDEVRTAILGYVFNHEHATMVDIADRMDLPRRTVAQHLRILAGEHMVQLSDKAALSGSWTVTPPMKKALAGCYDLLLILHTRAPAAPAPKSSG